MRPTPIILIVTLLLPSLLPAEILEVGTFDTPEFTNVRLSGAEIFRGSDSTQDIRLKPVSGAASQNNLLHLNFDHISAALRDQAGNYSIRESSYIPIPDARVGKGAALFNRRENKIVIQSPENLWPGVGPLEDFSFEMWLKPVYFYRKSKIFEKMSLLDGVQRGMEIYIEDSRLHLVGRNLFYDAAGNAHTLHLKSRSPLARDRWVHVALSYRAVTGKFLLYVDGRENQVRFARDARGVWQARFHPLDRAPILIGESYYGLLDEFRILNVSIQSEESPHFQSTLYAPLKRDSTAFNAPRSGGRALSAVLESFGGKVASGKLHYSAREEQGSLIKFWIRFANRPFRQETPGSELPWKRIHAGAEKIPAFRYFQWKAELIPDPTGRVSPVLRDVIMTYARQLPPPALRNFKIISALTGDKAVCIEWFASPNRDVKENGGYFVYYGRQPGEYYGRLVYRGGAGALTRIQETPVAELPLTATEKKLQQLRPEVFSKRFANRIRLLLTNDMIERNIIHSSPRKRLPFLENDQTYYLAISAYSNTGEESPLSEEVMVVLRPPPDL